MGKTKVSKLIRLKAFKPITRPIVAFDTEDDGHGNFKLGNVYGEYISRRRTIFIDKCFRTKKDLAEFLNGLPRYSCLIVAKNIEYDLNNLEPYIRAKRIYGGSGLCLAKTHKKVKIFDIGNHLDGSLGDLMPLVGMKKLPLSDLAARCRSDAKATYLLAVRLQTFYNRVGARFKSTIGATALDLFKRRFFKHRWIRPDFFNDFERKSYRGGRCELFNKNEFVLKSYDVNSMYVSVMKGNPLPEPCTVQTVDSARNFEENFKSFQGIVSAVVEVPEMFYPPLPYYHPELNKLIFPVGRFEGTWTFDELKMGMRNGVKVIKILKYCYYTASYFYFSDFAAWVWKERKAAKSEFDDMMIKKMGNSLYGKFGQRNHTFTYYGKFDDFDGELNETMRPVIIEQNGARYLLITGGDRVNSRHTFVCVSSYISSFARITLYEEMIKHQTVYTDTDNLKIIDKIRSSPALGGWKFEGSGRFKGYRPKFYRFDDVLKIKGVPAGKRRKGQKVKIVFEDDKCIATFVKPQRYREALRTKHKFNDWTKRKREMSINDDKRIWAKDGTSKPISISL